jgi:hypothetical protein
MTQANETEPSLLRWSLSVAASAGLTGMICCVAPMVLFMFGIMGGTYAISFADFFYEADGSAGMGAWGLRGIAVLVGLVGVLRYRQKQNQCSIDPKRQQKNLILLVGLIVVLGVGFFFSLDSLSSWYFDAYIVPAQQLELNVGT